MKSGVVYSQDGQGASEVNVARVIATLRGMSRVMSKVGAILMAAAAAGILFIYLPLGLAELRYTWWQTHLGRQFRQMNRNVISVGEGSKVEVETVEKPTVREEMTEKLVWSVPDTSYSIYIPKIEARSRVIKDVDANKTADYQKALKLGVAEALGLAHPGEKGTTFLFAHSVGSRADFARYNAVFYLLDKVEPGDNIEVVYENKLIRYVVAEKEILLPNNLKYLIPQTEVEQLVLQTCYPPGTTWKRLMVIAKRV